MGRVRQPPTVRTQLMATLVPLLPRTWRVVPVERNIDPPDRVTIVLKQGEIERAPTAPLGKYAISYVVTVVSPAQTIDRAEIELDDAVLETFNILTGVPWINPSKATKVLFQGQYLAYDIACSIETKKGS